MATSESLDQLVKVLVDAGREDTPELRDELNTLMEHRPASPRVVRGQEKTQEEKDQISLGIIVTLTHSDLEQRAKLASAWGILDARKLIADTAARWAAETLRNGEAKRKK